MSSGASFSRPVVEFSSGLAFADYCRPVLEATDPPYLQIAKNSTRGGDGLEVLGLLEMMPPTAIDSQPFWQVSSSLTDTTGQVCREF